MAVSNSNQNNPALGSTVVVKMDRRNILTKIIGVKDDGDERSFTHEAGTSTLQDITVIPDRMAGLMENVLDGLAEYYPAAASKVGLADLYLAAATAYRDTGDVQGDDERLRDAAEEHLERAEYKATTRTL